jgi:dolichol-phosphate mannosyltransferase
MPICSIMRPALARLLCAIKAQDLDVVIGSRYAVGFGIGEGDRRRITISGIAAFLARLVVPAELSDPMSGFFLISRLAFERAARRLSGQGF